MADWPEFCVCSGDWDDWEPAPLAQRGRLAWINTQLSLARRGKPMQVDCPGFEFPGAWHEIRVYTDRGGAAPPAPLQRHVDLWWVDERYRPGWPVEGMFWGRMVADADTHLVNASKYTYWGCVPMQYGERVDLDDLLVATGALLAGRVVSLRVAIAEPLLAPYCWARRDFLNVAL
jgi:hypothetical protein